jgi:UrcA family protein
MSISITSRALACALAALGAATALPAQTIDVTGGQRLSAQTRTIQVRYSDIDLRADRGRDQLDRRIRWAAGAVCGSNPIRGLERRNDHAACETAAIAGAQPRVASAVQSAAAGGGD